MCVNIHLLTLGQAEGTIHPQPHLSVRLSAVNHGIVGPQAEPVVGEDGDQVMGEEQQQTDEGQNHTDGFHIGPEDRQLDLREERRAAHGCVMMNSSL